VTVTAAAKHSKVAEQLSLTNNDQGRSSASTTKGSIEEIRVLILDMRMVTVDEVANQLQIIPGVTKWQVQGHGKIVQRCNTNSVAQAS
jgi:hypothetical protein